MDHSASHPVFARDWWFKQYGDHVESLINKRSNEVSSWRQRALNLEREVRSIREEMLHMRTELSHCHLRNEVQAEELATSALEVEKLQKQLEVSEAKIQNAPSMKLPAGADRDAVSALMMALEACKRELEEANLRHRREMQDLRRTMRINLRREEATSGSPSAFVSDAPTELADWEVRIKEIKETHEQHVTQLEQQLSECHHTIRDKSEEMEELRVQNEKLFEELRRLRLVERLSEELEARLNDSGQAWRQLESSMIGSGSLPPSLLVDVKDDHHEDSLDHLRRIRKRNETCKGPSSLSVFRRDQRRPPVPDE
jgi:chromosome segregation ATPase